MFIKEASISLKTNNEKSRQKMIKNALKRIKKSLIRRITG